MIKNKRGFEIQFNWIFVLIAGAVIIFFFAMMLTNQKKVSDSSVKATIIKGIESIISGASVSPDTTSPIDFPESEVKVECGKISVESYSKQFQNLILFAPESMKGKKFITQTSSFNLPFRVTNMLYMTGLNINYVLIGTNNLFKEINSSLPDELKKELFQDYFPSQIRSNNYKVRIILIGERSDFPSFPSIFPNSLRRLPDSDVTAVKIIESEKIAEFYMKNGNSWEHIEDLRYLEKSSALGAVYSDSPDNYECSMKNALKKLNIVAQVLEQKTSNLRNSPESGKPECILIYDNVLDTLREIIDASSENSIDFNSLLGESSSLKNQNEDLKLPSCPRIF